jgi:hypothetical protein
MEAQRVRRRLGESKRKGRVDTKAIYASGSLFVNENYLYTREAMVDLLTRLRPNGVSWR